MEFNLPKINSKVRPELPKLNVDIPKFKEPSNKIPKIKPPKKFKIGDIVCRRSRRSLPLTIWDAPQWNDWCEGINPQWYYPYEYGLGGTSEGCALESELVMYNENNTINTINNNFDNNVSNTFEKQFQKITKIDVKKPSGPDIFDDGMLPNLRNGDDIV